jgi:hypothetical protein
MSTFDSISIHIIVAEKSLGCWLHITSSQSDDDHMYMCLPTPTQMCDAQRRQIRWVEVNGPAGVAACARAGRSKSARRFTPQWFDETVPVSRRWIAWINSSALGEFLKREIAMQRVEELVETSMVLVLHDWELYRAEKAKR